MIINSELKNIVLLHGALGTKNDLLPLKNLLLPKYNVFSFNFSGHGDNTQEHDFTIKQFTLNLQQFVEENNIESTFIFGYSMGGYVALNYALQFPQKVEKIFTLGTKLEWNEEFAAKQAKFLNAEKLLEKVPAFANYLASKHQPNNWKIIVEKTAGMMQLLGSNPLLNNNTLPKIETPTYIAIGDKDDMVTKEESEWAVSLLQNANFNTIIDTPHPIEKVNHSTIVAAVTEWFN